MFDLHTHHAPSSADIEAVVNRSFGQPHAPAAPWFSAGLHPWHLSSGTMPEARGWLIDQAEEARCYAIGEAGLDKVCDTPWELQMEAFRFCVELAIAAKKPLILHCVRAFEEVLAVKKEFGAPAEGIKWIFHGFNKRPELAQQLLRAGCYLSFGAAILRADSSAAQSLRVCPAGRYFLETDDQVTVSIGAVYAAARGILGV